MQSCPSDPLRERFLAGALADDAAQEVEAHLAGCDRCRSLCAQAREEEDLLGPLRELWRDSPEATSAGHADGSGDDFLARASGDALLRYRIGPLIGTGGMGLVYEAEQHKPRRRVALKVMRPGLSTERMLERFEFEAEVLGKLDHPGIARIHEAGRLGNGADTRPFYSMELVAGEPLIEYALSRELSTDARLRLFLRVCEAVEHAHRMGVVHRDLKPTNVLVSDAGDPKVLDFGVARALGADVSAETLTTHSGRFEGTLAYASPEQISGGSTAIDVRSDVYALGVLFHELLTGARPFDFAGLPIDEAVRTVREEPPRPLDASDPALGGDLQTIGFKALEKEPQRRYATVSEFAADVERYLARQPIAARPPSALYHLTRFSQRHFGLVAGVTSVFVALVVGLVVNLVLKEEARRGRDNVLRLSAFRELRELERRAEEAWPIDAALEQECAAWLEDARRLLAGLHPDPAGDDPGHYAQRDAIRARALTERPPGSPPAAEPYVFEDDEDAWWHDQLEQLIGALEALADPGTGLVSGASQEFGWGMQRRLAWARELEQRSLTGPEARSRWSRAIASIADARECPAYDGLVIQPQLGLLPLARSPESGLWEFAHVLSGADLEFDPEDPRADLESSIVLVLIPPGTFAMGAQREDAGAANYDPATLADEGPVHQVTLSPFFLAKTEMTQDQWLRLTGANPSVQAPRDSTPRELELLQHPVENVRWSECVTTLQRFGLALPTEAQWEYAARAGTTTPWWSGRDAAALAEVANLADETCRRQSRSLSWVFEAWDDGFHQHAPVASLRANAFGLHDVSGNVWEWCADALGLLHYSPEAALDPWTPPSPTDSVLARGGSWNDPAVAVRVTIRNAAPQSYRGRTMGVRPARALEQGAR